MTPSHYVHIINDLIAERDAARAEAQHLREQRDAYKEMVERFIQDCKDCVVIKYNGTPRYEPTYGDNDLYEWRAMLDRIAAEDASAEGGEG